VTVSPANIVALSDRDDHEDDSDKDGLFVSQIYNYDLAILPYVK